ncbi:hypothetical protein U9M48_001883, partial [Paspalum notatum var. saurae]
NTKTGEKDRGGKKTGARERKERGREEKNREREEVGGGINRAPKPRAGGWLDGGRDAAPVLSFRRRAAAGGPNGAGLIGQTLPVECTGGKAARPVTSPAIRDRFPWLRPLLDCFGDWL